MKITLIKIWCKSTHLLLPTLICQLVSLNRINTKTQNKPTNCLSRQKELLHIHQNHHSTYENLQLYDKNNDLFTTFSLPRNF
jgi:hypothetical protein